MDFLSFLPKNMQNNIIQMRKNPKVWVQFQLKVIRIALWALCILIGYQFIKVIIGFNSGSSTFGMIGRLITFLIMLWVFYAIWTKGYTPMKNRIEHYANQNVPTNNINVNQLVDDTLKHFEKGGVNNVLQKSATNRQAV